MKKKTLLAILTLCVALSATAFAACKNNDNPPEPAAKTDNAVVIEDIAEIECGESATFSAKTEDGAAITFVYSDSENGEYVAVPETFMHGEYYVKAIAAETENHKQTYSAAKKLVVNEILTSYDEERSEEYDYGVCACGELIEGISFRKRVEGVQEIVVTAIENIKRPTAGSSGYAYTEKYLTPSISLGEIGEKAESIGEITLGEISLGNDINALDLSGLTDKTINGEQNLLVRVTDDKGFTHNAVVPVLLITREIATNDELNVLLGGDEWRPTYIVNGTEIPKTEGENRIYGYYKLTSDINYTATTAGNTLHGVTFDGGNHKITIGTEEKGAPQRGIFGDIYSDTVIKNLVIDAAYSNPDKEETTRDKDSDYNTVLASQAYGSTFENITVNYVAGKDSTYSATKGLLVNYQVGACTFKDITINANGKKLGAVLCFSEASIEEFVFENFVINDCAGIGCLVTAKEGKVQPWDVKGVKGEVKQTVKPEISIDPASEEIVSVPLGEAYATLVKSVASVTKITAEGTREDVTEYCNFTEEGFWFYESDVAAESDRKKNITLEIVYDSESFDVTLETVLYVKGTETEAELPFSQSVVLADENGVKKSFVLMLGEYGNASITEVRLGDLSLPVTNNIITITDELRAETHGDRKLTVFAETETGSYVITAPVTIVTESIASFARLTELVSMKESVRYGDGKYYTLSGNISVPEGSAFESAVRGGANTGFAGIFDGNGYSIIGGKMGYGGLFGGLIDATIKNVHFKNAECVADNYRSVIAGDMYNAVFENVSIEMPNDADASAEKNAYGIVASDRVVDCEFIDLTITAPNAKIFAIFGSGWNNALAGNYKCTNVSITAKRVICIAVNSNNTDRLAIDGVEGLTVTETQPAVYYTVTFVQRSGERTETTVEEGMKLTLPVAEAAGENERFVGWQTAEGKIWNENADVVTGDTVLTAVYETVINKRYESVLIDECVLKTDCAEGTEGFTEESGDLAEGFEKRYIKTVTGEYVSKYSHKDISRYNTVKFAIRTTANYRFNNFGATDDPRVYAGAYAGWTYWVLTKTADKEWNLKVYFGEELKFDYTHTGCADNAICYVLYHGVSGGDFMTYPDDYSVPYTIECTELRYEKEITYTDEKIGDAALKTDCAETSEGFEEKTDYVAPAFQKRYVKTVTGENIFHYSHLNIGEYDEVRFAVKTNGNYRFNNFGATSDPRVYAEAFDGWSYWVFTKTADKEWNVKIYFGDELVFDYTHTGCADNTICNILYHGVSGGDFMIYPSDYSAPYTIECTEIRGVKNVG